MKNLCDIRNQKICHKLWATTGLLHVLTRRVFYFISREGFQFEQTYLAA